MNSITRKQENATKRHNEVRDYLFTKLKIERSFLTGSYARHTKTKPLKDIDIFFVLKNEEKQGKQTSGIASINMRRLKAFPLLAPPLDLQQRFAHVVARIEHQKGTLRGHAAHLDTLFASLQHRAFSGEF